MRVGRDCGLDHIRVPLRIWLSWLGTDREGFECRMLSTAELAIASLDEVNELGDNSDNLLGWVILGLFPSDVLQLLDDLREELRVKGVQQVEEPITVQHGTSVVLVATPVRDVSHDLFVVLDLLVDLIDRELLEPREIDVPDLKRVEVLLLTREHIPDVSQGAPPPSWHVDLSYARAVSGAWTYPSSRGDREARPWRQRAP